MSIIVLKEKIQRHKILQSFFNIKETVLQFFDNRIIIHYSLYILLCKI